MPDGDIYIETNGSTEKGYFTKPKSIKFLSGEEYTQ